MIGNVNQPSTHLIMDVDGTLKAGAVDVAAVLANGVVETAKIADDAVTLAKLQNITRGSIIVGGTADAPTLLDANDSGKLLVGDGTDLKSVALSGNATLSSAGALTLQTGLAQSPNLVWDPFNEFLPLGANHLDRTSRWMATNNLEIVSDANNPFGKPTLRLAAAGTLLGKLIALAETGVAPGQSYYASWTGLGSTDSITLYITWRDGAMNSLGGTSIPSATTGAVQTLTRSGTIPAGTVYVQIYVGKTGTANALDTYHMGLWAGAYIGALPSYTPADTMSILVKNYTDRSSGQNLIFDPYNYSTGPAASHGTIWRGRSRFYSNFDDSNLSIVDADTNNPFGQKTLRIGTVTAFGGKRIYLDEVGLRSGDWVTVAIACRVASGTFRINTAFYTAADGYISNFSTTAVNATGDVQILSDLLQVPATAGIIQIALNRVSGSADMDIYAMALSRGRMPAPFTPSIDITPWAAEIETARGGYDTLSDRLADTLTEGDYYGAHLLRNWQAQTAKIWRSESGAQVRVSVVGDSWCYGIATYLRTALIATYGDAGPGFQQFSTSEGDLAFGGAAWTRAGTWTEVDATALAKGPAARHVSSTDTSTPAAFHVTATCQAMIIHYVKQSGGGSFRYRVDGGGWTIVATDAASAYATEAITGLSNASHTLDIEVTAAGTGVVLTGVDCKLTGIGCIVDWLGNGGAAALSYSQLDSTIWSAAMTALAPHVVILLLGTNDHNGNVVPGTYATRMNTVIDRIQAALPLTDVLLLSPADNGLEGKTYTVADYVSELRGLATTKQCAMLNSYLNIGLYVDGDARGLYENTSHLNDTGYSVVARCLIDRLLK